MKTLSIKWKIVISIVSIGIVLSSIWFIQSGLQKRRIATRVPILKVMSQSHTSWLSSGKKHYYIVYDNGDYEEVDEFSLKDIEMYPLYSIDSIDMSDELVSYSEAVTQYAETIDNSNLYNLYVLNGRYFFDIHDNRTLHRKYGSIIFEYFPKDHSVKRIVKFKDYYTKYVELYKDE